MKTLDDPFKVVVDTPADEPADAFAALTRKPVVAGQPASAVPSAIVARLQGFDLAEGALVSDIPGAPNQVVPARTTVALRHSQVGAPVVLIFEGGDVLRPIIVGVIDDRATVRRAPEPALPQQVAVEADDERCVINAEREIVLRCGEASITLTRAGKVIIKGAYIVSRSTGYNRIKGAAVDIN